MVNYSHRQAAMQQESAMQALLNETNDFFESSFGTNILGEGIKDVYGSTQAFSAYVEKLTEDIEDPTEADTLAVLMENARMQTLTESATAGVAPVAALSLPTLRVMWAKTGLVHAIPTEPVTSNAFSVSFNRPCIIDENGDKHYLPEALDLESTLGDKKALTTEPLTLPLKGEDLLAGVGASKVMGDSIDRDFTISSVTVAGEVFAISRTVGKLDINNRLFVEVKDADGVVIDTIYGNVNLTDGTINVLSMEGTVEAITIRGFVASDSHNHATNITFDMVREDFQIGTGEHFEAALPIEFLQDTMATYTIDGTTEVVDTMSNIVAQKLDMEIFNFIDSVYEGTNAAYYGEFDLRPSSSYAGNPKEWREELKTVIDHLAATMKSKTHVYSGYFVIMGNPVDVALIPNVNWTFNQSTDTQAGVEVSYSLGAMSGSNKYSVVSSDIIPQGALHILFVPTIKNYKSVTYYPYTFNVVNSGYLNTRTSNVPSIMMTKRHTIEEFTPLVMKIDILNNTPTMLAQLPRA